MSSLDQSISTHQEQTGEFSPRDDASGISPDETLDVSGLLCPLPGIKMAGAIRKLDRGRVIEVRSSNPMVRKFAPTMLRETGNEVLAVVEGTDGLFRLFVKKG